VIDKSGAEIPQVQASTSTNEEVAKVARITPIAPDSSCVPVLMPLLNEAQLKRIADHFEQAKQLPGLTGSNPGL